MPETVKNKRKFVHIPRGVLKELQNLQSWRTFYKELGTSNPAQVRMVGKQILELKEFHNIQDHS